MENPGKFTQEEIHSQPEAWQAALEILDKGRRELNIFKNYELKHIPFPVLFNLVYHAFKFILFCGTLRLRCAQAVLRAYVSLFQLISYVRKERRVIQKRRKVPDSFLIEHGFIASLRQTGREYLRLMRT